MAGTALWAGYYRHMWPLRLQGLYSLSGKTSYGKISWSLEAARFDIKLFQSLWNLAGTSAALLPRCLSNFRAIRPLRHPISRLRDFTRFGGKTSYRLVNRGPEYKYQHQYQYSQSILLKKLDFQTQLDLVRMFMLWFVIVLPIVLTLAGYMYIKTIFDYILNANYMYSKVLLTWPLGCIPWFRCTRLRC